MQHDPNAEVRLEACKTIAANRQTLPKLLDRCRDVNKDVRLAAYESISKKVKLTALDTKQRVRLLEYGLKDRSGTFSIRDAAKESIDLPQNDRKCFSSSNRQIEVFWQKCPKNFAYGFFNVETVEFFRF